MLAVGLIVRRPFGPASIACAAGLAIGLPINGPAARRPSWGGGGHHRPVRPRRRFATWTTSGGSPAGARARRAQLVNRLHRRAAAITAGAKNCSAATTSTPSADQWTPSGLTPSVADSGLEANQPSEVDDAHGRPAAGHPLAVRTRVQDVTDCGSRRAAAASTSSGASRRRRVHPRNSRHARHPAAAGSASGSPAATGRGSARRRGQRALLVAPHAVVDVAEADHQHDDIGVEAGHLGGQASAPRRSVQSASMCSLNSATGCPPAMKPHPAAATNDTCACPGCAVAQSSRATAVSQAVESPATTMRTGRAGTGYDRSNVVLVATDAVDVGPATSWWLGGRGRGADGRGRQQRHEGAGRRGRRGRLAADRRRRRRTGRAVPARPPPQRVRRRPPRDAAAATRPLAHVAWRTGRSTRKYDATAIAIVTAMRSANSGSRARSCAARRAPRTRGQWNRYTP